MPSLGVISSIVLLHVVGWGALVGVVAAQPTISTSAFGVGVGFTAYLLGVRHAFDADHIAAIDNTTRKLLQDRRAPGSVGFWFSCGHSTVVFLLTLLLAIGVPALAGPIIDDSSQLRRLAGVLGTSISAGFLYTIAALNIIAFVDLRSSLKRLREGGEYDEMLEAQLASRGLMNRVIRHAAGLVRTPRQMYAVGLLFGLGFDTATEIALLVLASAGAASGLPWYAALCLPILFAAGMSLFDTAQGSFMTAAYGSAFARPAHRIYYNLTITGLSVAVALIIGTVEIVGLIGDQFELRGSLWDAIAAIDLNLIGFGVAGLFIATWLVSAFYWRFGTVDKRYVPQFGNIVSEGD
jgi:high-affinity nickel-transport protein